MFRSGVFVSQRTGATGLALMAGLAAGLIAVANVDRVGPLATGPISQFVTLPSIVYVTLTLGVVAAVLSIRHWWVGIALFFAWLPFEDLVRKSADNDLRVYFIKDVLLVLALVGIAPRLIGYWRRTLGSAWLPTVALLSVAVLLALPSALINPRLPAAGLKVRFLYLLLLPIGAFLAADVARLRRALAALSVLSAITCAIGIAQAVIGPTFLNPSGPIASIKNAVVVRGFGATAVVRPSGPFVDAGRFASMTTVALVLGLCVYRLAESRGQRRLGLGTCAIAVSAAFASGGRTALLYALALVAFGFLFSGSKRLRPALAAGAIAVVLVLGANSTGTLKDLSADRAAYYGDTLNPASKNSDVDNRLRYFGTEAVRGIRAGGLLGQGTGTQSLGRQYLAGQDTSATAESGFGSVASEWGILGLAVWLLWSWAWLRRALAAARSSAATPAGPALSVIGFFLALTLTISFAQSAASFDNYITNVFFWLLSGVAFASLARTEENAAVRERQEQHLAEAGLEPRAPETMPPSNRS